MSRIYKILFDNGQGKKEMFAIKPFLGRFDDFKDEIFIRMPELKTKSLKFYYEDDDGDKITIFNTNDFAIFQEQAISKVFVDVQKPNCSVNFSPLISPWPLSAPQVYTPNFMAAAPGISKKLPSSVSADLLRLYVHTGVVCDNCDKEIRGYRYKCLECADFDLCMECEPSNHSQHLLLRIANPNDAEICYRAKLGKRFGRHRRSESLCSKPTEDRHHDKKGYHDKKAHHKRHAPCSRSANFADVVSDILKSVVGPGVDARPGEASGSNENPKPQENHNDQNGKKPTTSSTAAALNTPLQGPLHLPMPTFNNPGNGKLKTHIDTLSNMAQHFAAMMDPFATYINESAANIASGQTPVAVPENLNERAQDILKTLTSDNVDSVSEQLNALNITNEKMSDFVSLIFEKAVNAPHLSAEIAKLAKKLSALVFDGIGTPMGSVFKKALLNKCQNEFQAHFDNMEGLTRSKLWTMQAELSTTPDVNRKIVLNTLIEAEESKLRRRSLGIVRFIGELYRQDILITRTIESCIVTLLSVPTESKLEYLCEFLTVVGQKMEYRTGDAESDKKYYRDLMPFLLRMQDIVNDKKYHKVHPKIWNLMELRKNNWIQRSEPMDGVNTTEEMAKSAEPKPSNQNQSVAMVVDCSDDEEECAGIMNRASRESSSDGSQSEKSNRGDSPSREWAFVDANEIDDMGAQAYALAQANTLAQDGPLAAKVTGTLPKQLSKQSDNAKLTADEPSLDYSELSRRLNDHIIGEKRAENAEENLAAAPSTESRIHKTSESQVQPIELAPKVTASAPVTDDDEVRQSTDPRIIQAINTMAAMGFSNEGGWLTQLLEAVNGDITNAIELMQPHK